GWSCTLASLSCSRTDQLPAGASYPPITVTVNIASSAPSAVTNVAVVSGGGETNAANDTASDVTTIAPPTTVRLFLTSGTTWTVPSDWNNANNTIEVIGGGGGSGGGFGSVLAGGGGGGGGYSKVVNLTLTPNATVSIQVGAGGSAAPSNGAGGT